MGPNYKSLEIQGYYEGAHQLWKDKAVPAQEERTPRIPRPPKAQKYSMGMAQEPSPDKLSVSSIEVLNGNVLGAKSKQTVSLK